MNFNNDITLRPRFSFEVDQDAKIVLSHFKSHAKTKNNIRVSIVEPHVFLKITKQEQHFWSPQLHLEILGQKSSTTIKRTLWAKPCCLDFIYVFTFSNRWVIYWWWHMGIC